MDERPAKIHIFAEVDRPPGYWWTPNMMRFQIDMWGWRKTLSWADKRHAAEAFATLWRQGRMHSEYHRKSNK